MKLFTYLSELFLPMSSKPESKEDYLHLAIAVLDQEEGYRETPYLDSRGLLTCMGGILMSTKKGLNPKDFQHFRIPKAAGDVVMYELLKTEYIPKLEAKFPELFTHDPRRIAIYVSMAYQISVDGFSKFRNTIALLKAERFSEAATEALDSLWYKAPTEEGGTPERAKRHSDVIRDPALFEVYYG